MRFFLLSTVSTLMLALTPATSQAGFEFVPQTQNVKPAPVATNAATMPIVEQTPVASDNLPVIHSAPVAPSKNVTPPLAPIPAPELAPIVDAPVSGEPMVLGRKAIPLTPVVKESDALVYDAMPTAPIAETSSMPVELAKPKEIATVPAPMRVPANTSDVLWDNQSASTAVPEPVEKQIETSDLPPIDTSFTAPAISSANEAHATLDDSATVQGFGRQVPLAMALQQIVPPSYRYSFDHGVDPGMRITWTGGKPWKTVIADVARDNDLNVDIVTNVVAFRRRSPMDIVETQTDNYNTASDNVQGMDLKPVATPNPIVLPPIISEPSTTGKPMSLLDPAGMNDSKKPVASDIETFDAPTRIPPSGNPEADIKKAVTDKKIEDAKFDALLNSDSPSETPVKDKRILLADETDLWSPEAQANNKARLNKAQAEAQVDAKTDAPKIIEEAPAEMMIDAPMPIVPKADVKTPIEAATPAPVAMPIMKDEWMKPMPTDGIVSAPAMSASVQKVADLTTPSEWEAFKNQTLRETLTSWSERAGVSVVWSSEYDYPLQTDVRVKSGYADAVRTLLAGFSKAQPRPMGRLFKNDKVGAQPVLVVETQRLTN